MGLLVAAAVLVGQAARSVPAHGVTSSTPPYFTVAVTPTQDLVDGQKLSITVTRTAAGTATALEIHQVAIAWCAPHTELRHTTTDSLSSRGQNSVHSTALPGTAACSSSTFPLNGDPLLFTTVSPPEKPTGTYPSLTTTVQAQSTRGTTVDHGLPLACDATSPCTLAVAVQATVKATVVTTTSNTTVHGTYFFMTPVTYAPTTIAESCGGVATGELNSAGPDRLTGLLTTWTVGACGAKVGGGKELSTPLTSGQSDANALCGFASGRDDLAYSAVGYGTASSPFNPANCTVLTGGAQPDRHYVAVPIALNAVVLAHTQTLKIQTADTETAFEDYPSQLDITDGQLAQLLGENGHTQTWTGSTLGKGLLTENPTLFNDYFYVTRPKTYYPIIHRNPAAGSAKGAMVTSGAQATTYLATSLLHNLEPTTLLSQTKGHPKLEPTADFSTVTPRYDTIPITGLTNIVHNMLPTTGEGGDPWALLSASDADAIWFGLDGFALQVPGTTPPVYAAPSKANMDTAAADMLAEPDGTLVPNPQPTVAGGQTPYPLTYVEYAIVPTQPLTTSSCTPRTQSEANLVDWLDYITGPGQTLLPAGMAPLPHTLQLQAVAAIAQVGKTSAPPCGTAGTPPARGTTSGTTKATAPSSSATTGASPAGATGTTGEGNGQATGTGGTGYEPGSGSSLGRLGTEGVSGATSVTPGSGPAAGSKKPGHGGHVSAVNLANFRVADGPSWLWTVVGLLLLFLLLPGLVLVASGRSPRQVVAAAGRWLRGSGQTPDGTPPGDPS